MLFANWQTSLHSSSDYLTTEVLGFGDSSSFCGYSTLTVRSYFFGRPLFLLRLVFVVDCLADRLEVEREADVWICIRCRGFHYSQIQLWNFRRCPGTRKLILYGLPCVVCCSSTALNYSSTVLESPVALSGTQMKVLLELQVNYLGYYVLTLLLEDNLVAGAPSRVLLYCPCYFDSSIYNSSLQTDRLRDHILYSM
ncbi:hypothetical protein M758_4G045800 [Ceratodon purpureus]|nr:hypothetical protein M758_4G045800 [Ceratodon purpureus]